MSSRLPIEINPYRCIEQKRLINGEIALNKLPRLRELLSSDTGHVKVSFEFIHNEAYLPTIKAHIKVNLHLTCQRCLKTVEHEVDHHLALVLVKTEVQETQLQDSYDTYLVEEDVIFLPNLIEDELMLALPISIKHQQCDMVSPETDIFFSTNDGVDDTSNDESNNLSKENPFDILKKLKH